MGHKIIKYFGWLEFLPAVLAWSLNNTSLSLPRPRCGGRGGPGEERGGVFPADAGPARCARVHRPGLPGPRLQQGQGKSVTVRDDDDDASD